MSGPVRLLPADLLEELGIESPDDIDVEAIAQFCGATIVYEGLRGCEARIIGRDNEAIITVNSAASEGRRRFSAGHELGHWMRDRGKVGFACTNRMLASEWSTNNPEQRANDYAANLLMPEKMFASDARETEVTLGTAQELADRYRTSLTATAIRLVQLGSFPSMVVCSAAGEGRKWFKRSPDLPREIWPRGKPGLNTAAHELLHGTKTISAEVEVAADGWIDLEDAERYAIRESSLLVAGGLALSLLWWEDESQLLAFI